MNNFLKIYLDIINENNSKFLLMNSVHIDYSYISNPLIKQCLFSNHALLQEAWRTYIDITNLSQDDAKKFVFKNLNLAFNEIFNNESILKKIKDNVFNPLPLNLLITTDKFGFKEGVHMIAPILVNAKINFNTDTIKEIYILIKTAYFNNDYEFKQIKKHNYKRKFYQNDVPIHIQGESAKIISSSLIL